MTRIIMLCILLTLVVYLYIFSHIELKMRTIDKQVYGRNVQHLYNKTNKMQGQPTNKEKQNKSEISLTKRPYVKVLHQRLYMYSALLYSFVNSENILKRTLIIHAWQYKAIKGNDVTCCLLLNNRSILSIAGSMVIPLTFLSRAKLKARRYICPLDMDLNKIKSVSVHIDNPTCIKNESFYIKPTILRKSGNCNIGVCAKFVYGSMDAQKLIEWFEVNRLLGVDKVCIYTYKLNKLAMKVLEYYESIGIVMVIKGYSEPEKDLMPREVGEKFDQVWMDEQLIMMDCLTRLSDYKYIAILDVDEYIIPNVHNFKDAWIHLLDSRLKDDIAGIIFKTIYHVLDWGPSNLSRHLYIGRFLNATDPILDRPKYIYMPSRIIPESPSTHNFVPRNGYKRIFINPGEAAIHHYRACRKEWMKPIDDSPIKYSSMLMHQQNIICYDLRRSHSQLLQHVATVVEKNVTTIQAHLDIPNSK